MCDSRGGGCGGRGRRPQAIHDRLDLSIVFNPPNIHPRAAGCHRLSWLLVASFELTGAAYEPELICIGGHEMAVVADGHDRSFKSFERIQESLDTVQVQVAARVARPRRSPTQESKAWGV